MKYKKLIVFLILQVVFTSMYILSFHLPIRHIIPVYFYYGIFSLLILTFILIISIYALRKKINFDIKDGIITVLIFFSFNIYFFSMVPVTLDRSISVFLISELEDNKMTKKEAEKNFVSKYVYKNDAFGKRFSEQIYTGTVDKEKKKYVLSKKGKSMLKTFHFINKLFNVESNLLK